MNIDRRQLALPVLAIGLLGIVPALAASADEEAVAKNVEAFRAAQFALDAKALDALCAAELSYSHSDARVMDKATFVAERHTSGQSKALSLVYRGPHNSCRWRRGDRAVQVDERKRSGRWQETLDQSPHPDGLAKTGCGLETSLARGHQALIVPPRARMPPVVMTLVFGFLGLMAAWGIYNALKTGTTSSMGGWSFRRDDDPVGFSLMIFVKACFVVFGLAEILFALGLAGDPFKAIQDALPFLTGYQASGR